MCEVDAVFVYLPGGHGTRDLHQDGCAPPLADLACAIAQASAAAGSFLWSPGTSSPHRGLPEEARLAGTGVTLLAGFQMQDNEGRAVGSICLADSRRHCLSRRDLDAVEDVAQLVLRELQQVAAERVATSFWETLTESIEILPDGFALFDADDRLLICNEQYRRVYPELAHAIRPGQHFEEILREGLRCGQFPQARGREEDWLVERLAAHRTSTEAIEQLLPDGRWIRVLEKKLPNGGTVGFRVDITALKQRQAELYDLAHRDELTGAMSRRAILSAARHLAAQPDIVAAGLGVILLDLDHFKQVNDCHGHLAGDTVLREFAERARALLREDDHFGRLGGEEFLVVMPHADAGAVMAMAERLRLALTEEPVLFGGTAITATVSGGVTAVVRAEDIDDTFNRADQYLYAAKQAGRNRIAGDPRQLP
ncbi:diguanylate cyclase [Stappia sp.]|uniref:sensor domain-containing diguanylate cyclase n=1 Tax=Stappia sp. TaxID=1870903 RepID=UPI003D1435BE